MSLDSSFELFFKAAGLACASGVCGFGAGFSHASGVDLKYDVVAPALIVGPSLAAGLSGFYQCSGLDGIVNKTEKFDQIGLKSIVEDGGYGFILPAGFGMVFSGIGYGLGYGVGKLITNN